MRRIGLPHFAHLRAVAEGLDVAQCAARYLGTEHGHEAHSAHQQTVDAVRSIARRHNELWRLVGLSIKTTAMEQPTLEAFAEGRLEGFSDAEVLELYREAFLADRKTARNHRLRDRQLALIQRLETPAAVQPQPGDLMGGWFDDRTAEKLTAAGIISLGEINARIAAVNHRYHKVSSGRNGIPSTRNRRYKEWKPSRGETPGLHAQHDSPARPQAGRRTQLPARAKLKVISRSLRTRHDSDDCTD